MDYPQSSIWHARLNWLLKGLGLEQRLGSVLYNLTEFQVQWLLFKFKPEVLDFQNSCWYVGTGDSWCNNCPKCERIAFMRTAMGLPLPPGLNPINLEEMQSKSGRSLFAVDLGGGQYTEANKIAQILDACYDAAIPRIEDSLLHARIGIDAPKVEAMRYLQPEDIYHPMLLPAHVALEIELALEDHPLAD
jgi:hypothetical protein